VQTESAGRLRYRDQVSDGNLVVYAPGGEGHPAPLALREHPTAANVFAANPRLTFWHFSPHTETPPALLASGFGLTIHGSTGTRIP
jgi:hypothetical protein